MQKDLRQQLSVMIPRLRRFARGLAQASPQDADDLVQAACERALSRLHQFHEGSRFDSWVFRILQSIWFNERARIRESYFDPAGMEVHDDMAVRRMDASLTLSDVQRSFEGLPEEQRVVMLLVCLEGYTYAETSEIMGVPIGTVMSRLSRGRLALAAQLGAPKLFSQSNIVPISRQEND